MQTLTQLIYQSNTPWNNPYQGSDLRVVFVCSAGLLRSATAARIYAKKYNTRAAGSEDYALVPLSADLVVWAQKIVFVNKVNFDNASMRFAEAFKEKDVVVLDIPDMYEHMHPELIASFIEQFEPLE